MTTEPLSAVELGPPVTIGPSWVRDPDHPSGWLLPKASLGWDILRWQEGRLQMADGSPWRYTPEQLRLFLWWYAVDPDSLRLTYRDGVVQRLKGWGKDPFAATICATEFVGPCRPDWSGRTVVDPWGNEHPAAVEHPEAWVQSAAVSKDQTRNTMTLFPGLFTKAAISEFSIDLGKEIIYAHRGRCRIEAVTSSPRALEGARSTFVERNETHHWLSTNDGHEMDAVIERNGTKSPDGASRALSITNAFEPGEDSVAERARDAWRKIEAGESKATGFMYDSLEAPADAPLSAEAAPGVVELVRGDSTWLDVERIVQAILDPRNPPSRSRRFWYNQVVATEDAWVAPYEWDALALPSVVPDGELITIGFDGSKSDDHTALIGCVVETGHLFEIDVWTPREDTGEVDRVAIDGVVHQTFDKYDVVGFFSDVHPWESYIDRWSEELGSNLCVKVSPKHVIGFDMRTRGAEFTAAAEVMHDAIIEGDLTHDGAERFRQHVHNARRAPNKWGVTIRKEHRESGRKIDALAAAILARLARQHYMALPDSRKRRKRTGRASFL